MLVTAAQNVVLAFGIIILVMSVWGIFNPKKLMTSVAGVLDQSWGIYFAIAVRLVLGAALILAAQSSLYATAFRVLGWIAILAAFAIALMGRRNIRKLLTWFERLSVPMVRVWLLFGVAFGGFLMYAILKTTIWLSLYTSEHVFHQWRV